MVRRHNPPDIQKNEKELKLLCALMQTWGEYVTIPEFSMIYVGYWDVSSLSCQFWKLKTFNKKLKVQISFEIDSSRLL